MIDSFVGDYTYVGIGSVVRASLVGRFCSIAPDVFIGLVNHPTSTFASTHPAFYLSRPPAWDFVDQNILRGRPPGRGCR